MRLAVLDDYPRVFETLAPARQLAGHEVVCFHDAVRGAAALSARLVDFDGVLLTQQRTAFPAEVINALPSRLKVISQTGRAATHLDLDACRAKGITVLTSGQGDPAPPAELTWALILASRRKLVDEVNALRGGAWQTSVGVGLAGQVLGVWGLGRIGSRVAQVGAAFGMRVVAHGRDATRARAKELGVEFVDDARALFALADVLTVHLPMNAETRGLVTAELLASMKPGSLFVNTSRSALVVRGALEASLDAGRPGFAALDVFDEEPLPQGASLLARKNVLATPHLGFVTVQALEKYYASAVEQLLAHWGTL